MTAIDIVELQNLSNLTLEQFVTLHFLGDNRASDYYAALAISADSADFINVKNYADLASGVVESNSLNGVLANNFTVGVANSLSIDFSVDSNNRLRMQYELMVADSELRSTKVGVGGTGELTYQETIDIHTAALNAVGLPPTAFSLYTPLSILAEYDPILAQNLFEKTTAGDGGMLDVLKDGLLIGFGVKVSASQPVSDLLEDYADQAFWLSSVNDAVQETVSSYPGYASNFAPFLQSDCTSNNPSQFPNQRPPLRA